MPGGGVFAILNESEGGLVEKVIFEKTEHGKGPGHEAIVSKD